MPVPVASCGCLLPRTLGEVRTGVEAKVNNNLSLWGNVGVQLGDKGYSDTQGMLGVKYSW
ncbi:autotransporter outer membrane beta-barrel domain-containing protein [Escherichia coli]|nr:autotransporter outer membrane beta-barrel domain-containing protein [Escherichia coli]